MAKVLGRFQFALSLVASVALRMILRARCLAERQALGIVVLFAMQALTPRWVSAGIQRPLPTLQQEVISPIRAHDQVGRAVIGSVVVDVVDFLFALHHPTKSTLGYEFVLEDVSPHIRIWVIGSPLQDVAVGQVSPSPPVRILFSTVAPHCVTDAKQHGLTLTLCPPASVVTALSDWSRTPTTTTTNARRITQGRAPKVCAESTINLTLFRRLS